MSYAAVAIGIFLFIFAYFTFNAPKVDHTAQPTGTTATASAQTSSTEQFCQLVNEADAPTFQAPADNATKTGSEDDETLGTPVNSNDLGCRSRGPRHQFSNNQTTYRLIRQNVPLSKTNVKDHSENFNDQSCHFDSSDKLGINIAGIDTQKFKVFFPQIAGEISMDREIPSRTRGKNSDLLYFIDYGLVFLIHKDPSGNFVQYDGGTTQGDRESFYLADVYQDIGSNRPQLPSDAFACDSAAGSKIASSVSVIQPPQATSPTNDQLQLQYFVFGSGTSNNVVNGWGIHCKPAVYLYPPQKELVNVKVYPSGFLTYTDPPYDQNKGWTVLADPLGNLSTTSNLSPATYPYLYFESKIRDEVIQKPTKGWVVKYEALDQLYQDILPKLGLNTKQTRDFQDYWNKTLPASPYYFVGIINQDNVNQIEKLEITPKPDYVNRVRVYFERLDSPKTIEAPSLESKPMNASKFNVVEWGGMVKNDLNHPFTCSQ